MEATTKKPKASHSSQSRADLIPAEAVPMKRPKTAQPTAADKTKLSPSILPKADITALNVTDIALDQLLEKAKTLRADDKESYEETHAFTMVLVRSRTSVKELVDRVTAPLKAQIETITTEGARITGRIKEIEALSRPLKADYEARQKQLQREKEQAAAVKLLERTQTVINLGMEWTGMAYILGWHAIEAVEIKSAPDEQWEKSLKAVTDYRTAELLQQQTDREAAELLQQQQTEALNQQRKEQELQQQKLDADAKKLQDEIDAFERQKAELENTRLQAVADEDARLDKIKTDALKIRLQRLADLGIPVTRGRVLTLGDLRYEVTDIKEADETTFETIYQAFVDTGIVLADAQRLAEEQQAALDLKKKQQDEADEAARIKADTERTERLAPDIKLFADFLDQWDSQADLPLQQPEVRELARVFNDRIKMVVDSFKDAITTL